jgi:LacI family transcriptional regulator
MVRLKDIAECAGVSVMTVSKVLRDAPDISAATKVRIRALAASMGYVPDSQAQGLRTRTTKLLGLIIPSVTHPIFAQIILAIEERAFELGYEIILAHTLNQPEREETCLRKLLSRRVDGILAAPVYRMAPTASIFEELKRCGTPLVVLGQPAPFCNQFTSVSSDDIRGSAAGTRHLLELGHRRIAFLSGPTSVPWAQERLQGYRRALRDHQVDSDDRLVFSAGTSVEDGEKAALQLLEEAPGVSAIQASSDLVAMGAARVMLNQGVRIPEDLSVVGFGNIPAAEHFRTPLTTLREPKHRLGLAAMEVMVKLIKREKAESKTIPADLIIRASTAARPETST